jgi:phage-related minor tail protein
MERKKQKGGKKMSVEDRLIKLEEFAADVRNFTKALTDMMRRHDERLDEHAEMFREASRSIAALADAQIRTEDSLKKVIEMLDQGGS